MILIRPYIIPSIASPKDLSVRSSTFGLQKTQVKLGRLMRVTATTGAAPNYAGWEYAQYSAHVTALAMCRAIIGGEPSDETVSAGFVNLSQWD